MTILKSRLVTPDAKPIVGRKVTATLMYRPSWITSPAKGGRALGSVTGYTEADGVWRIELMPVTQFEEPDYVWYQIDEGGEQTWRVTFDEREGEVWLKDKLIDPPPPPPDYIAIDKLGSLHDVDRDSVNAAPDGAVLVKRGGKWVAETPTFGKERLRELADVDAPSVQSAEYEDPLIYLGDNRWGTSRFAVLDVHYGLLDPAGPRTFWFRGAQYTPGYQVEYLVTPGMDAYVRWGDPAGRLEYTFPDDGTYMVQVRYLGIDGDEQARTEWGTTITIPFEEER